MAEGWPHRGHINSMFGRARTAPKPVTSSCFFVFCRGNSIIFEPQPVHRLAFSCMNSFFSLLLRLCFSFLFLPLMLLTAWGIQPKKPITQPSVTQTTYKQSVISNGFPCYAPAIHIRVAWFSWFTHGTHCKLKINMYMAASVLRHPEGLETES